MATMQVTRQERSAAIEAFACRKYGLRRGQQFIRERDGRCYIGSDYVATDYISEVVFDRQGYEKVRMTVDGLIEAL